MMNVITLNFKDDELNKKYLEYNDQNIYFKFKLILFAIVKIELAYTIQAFLNNYLFEGINLAAVLLFKIVIFLTLKERITQYNNIIIIFMILYNILFTLINAGLLQFLNSYQGFNMGCIQFFLNYSFYYQVNEFQYSTTFFTLTQIVLAMFSLKQPIDYVIYFILCSYLIAFKYNKEKHRKLSFLSKLQNDKWDYVFYQILIGQIIENLIPCWILTVKYNELTRQLDLQHANQNFKKAFGIQNITDIRQYLRSLRCSQEDGKPVNIESHLIKQLKVAGSKISYQETFKAVQRLQFSKPQNYIIKVCQINELQPSMAIMIEKEVQNEYLNEYHQKISQNNYYYQWLVQSQMQVFSQSIKLFQFLSEHDQKNILCHTLGSYLLQHYHQYKIALNTQLLIDLYMGKKFKLFQSAINLRNLLSQIFDIYPIFVKNKSHQLIIFNDSQKLFQIISSAIGLVKFVSNHGSYDDIIIKIADRLVQDQVVLKISITHPKAIFTQTIQDLFQVCIPTSLINSNRFGNNQKNIRSYIDKSQEEFIHYVLLQSDEPQKHQEVWAYLVQLQFLVSQLGPFNKVFFLNKEKSQNKTILDSKSSKKLSFYIYQELKRVSEQIKKD
ncbi:hypothetical protein pb186bvf_006809 [Paramecium bursaria]